MKRAVVLFSFFCLAITVGVRGADAQTETNPDMDRLVARELIRIALIDLRQQAEPGSSDYALASAMLGIARELTPDDSELIRRQIESERAAGNERAVMLLTRDLVRLDPSDSIAQLRLLSWNASQKQTVGDRLAVYNLYLGPKGEEAIKDPAVRSRLALDAALLHREEGNEREFIRLLSLATSLDSSNKEAASLALAFYQERRNDPVATLELAINLLRADPIDPNLHFGVAAELAKNGVFDQSQRFHDNARRLIASDGVTYDEGIETESIILRWHTGGPGVIVSDFERQLLVQREAARLRVDQLLKTGQTTEGVKGPEDIRLPISSERLRVLAALSVGDGVVVERSLKDLAASVVPELEALVARTKTPAAQENPELMNQLINRAAAISSELVVARLVAGRETQAVVDELPQLRPLFQSASKTQLDVIDSLLVLRQGRIDEAIELFRPLSEISTLGSVGLGLSLEAAGRNEEAEEAYKRTALFSPISPMGVFARSKYEKLAGQSLVYSANTEAMRRVADDVPRWMDTLTTDPNRFMSLTASLEATVIDPYVEPVITLNVRNTSPIALALGSDRPINSRLMVSPSMDVEAFPVDWALTPEVVDLKNRIRLVPGESLSMRIWPDPGFSGWLADLKSGHRVRNRWNLLQGFVIGSRSLYRAGPMCLSVETPQLTRRPDPRVRASIEDLIRELEINDEQRLIQTLLTIRSVLVDPDRPGGHPEAKDIVRVASTLAARYPALSRTTKLAVIAIAPHAVLCPGMEQLDERLLTETDSLLLMAAIFTRVRSAENPVLARAEASEDAQLAAVARILRSRLETEGAKGFAMTKSPGSHRPKAPEHPDSVEPE